MGEVGLHLLEAVKGAPEKCQADSACSFVWHAQEIDVLSGPGC